MNDKNFYITKEELENLYNKKITVDNILKKFNIRLDTLYKFLHKYNIPLRKPIKRYNNISRETLVETYNNSKNIREVARKLNITECCIGKVFKKHNILIRKKQFNLFISKEILIDLYNVKGLSSMKIANMHNVKDYKILGLMKFYNIPRRTRTESYNLGFYNQTSKRKKYVKHNNKYITKEKILDLYINKNMTKKRMAKELNMGSPRVNKWFKFYNIKNIVRKGLLSPFLKSTVKYEKDGRKKILLPEHHRSKLGWVYNQLVVIEKKLGRNLKIDEVCHHINGDCTDDREENLQVMTRSNHSRLHGLYGGFKK